MAPDRLADIDGVLARSSVHPSECMLVCRNADDAVCAAMSPLVVAGSQLVVAGRGDDEAALVAMIERTGAHPSFVGSVQSRGPDANRRFSVAIVDHLDPAAFAPTPSEFSAMAIMTTFNEEDVVNETVGHLAGQGVNVHLIDNWSTDSTVERVASFRQSGRVTVEQYPRGGAPGTYDWRALLHRVEEIAATCGADWVMHNDADEIRRSPWPGVKLRDAFYQVGRAGFNAVDHTVIEFWPVDDSPIRHLERDRSYFQFGLRGGHFVQIKAWQGSAGRELALASSGGHQAVFEGRRVFPYKFLTKHYPIRSQAQGEKKVFRDRRGRWNPEERSIGWHVQYDGYQPGESFLRDADGLEPFDEERFNRHYLIERLSGLNLPRTA
jgi:hypothetical protein